jgi:hypothetical protein
VHWSVTLKFPTTPLYFIPTGFINELKPLGRYVLAALKAMCGRMFHRFLELVSGTVRKSTAVEFMCRAWAGLQENVIRKTWRIFEEPDDSFELTDEEVFEDET